MSPPSLTRVLERVEHLVTVETPSADADRLLACYEPLREWGTAALRREPDTITRDGVPHLYWPAAEPSVLLLMHADTVFAAGTIDSRPFRIEDGRAYGPGVFDMKSGIVMAFEALEQVENPAAISLVITGDEEIGSPTSRPLIEEAAANARATLVPEPSLDGALKTSRKGGGIYEVRLEGREAHAGLEPERGHNALVELAHVVTHVCELADPARGTTVTPTTARAGTTTNTVPADARVGIDVRAGSIEELRRVDDALRTMSSRNAHVRIRLDGGINRPPLEDSASRGLYAIAREAAAAAGLPAVERRSVGGASDGNFTAALGVPTLDGLGAVGDGAHTPEEWIDVASLPDRTRLIAAVLTALETKSVLLTI
ncbi:M20 family metallopeptidase [Solicola gregarius]|uniref:M20 family metallopeptidase n=1 Tax=Solicola gregarius TaxID=2908642 RepID=A0AA46YK92_9ACTN|nr:M20 family metallopeptidase [Solicola gregarius]UYM04241.1 M20 family metallopeptidase [Solicola gregarius]